MTVAVIERKDLDAALRDVAKACTPNKNLPVLSGVRLAFRDSRLTLETTDLDTSITLSVALAERGARGQTVVPLKVLQQALKHRTGLLELDVQDNGSLSVGTDGSRSLVAGLDLADWPKIAEPTERPFKVTDAMAAAIKRVAVAASRDDCRPILTGVHFGRGYITATDSYRLAFAGPFQPVADMLVPADALVEATAAGSEMAYDAATHRLMILDGAKETIIHTIDGQYPNWRRNDVQKPLFTMRFSRPAAIAALKRAEAAPGRTNITPVKMSRRADRRGVQFEVVVNGRQVLCEQVAGVGTMPEEVGFNPTFLRQGCEACTGQSVEMWSTDNLKPAKLVDGFFSYRLMPVRTAVPTSYRKENDQ